VNADWERGYAAGYAAAHKASLLVAGISIDPLPAKPAKRTRKPSAYNKRYSKEYKRLAKKHPRLKFAALSKRTHKALRRKK
jgi:hypothetical protein